MARKLQKSTEGTVIRIKELETGTERSFDFIDLPETVQDKLGPFGLSHKLGDAAAGKTGMEIIGAIEKVFEGLMQNNWTVRAPAAPKITKKVLNERLNGMSAEDQSAARALLEQLNIVL